MAKLLKHEPDGTKKLYKDVDPAKVDATICDFTDSWLKKALRIAKIKDIQAHIIAGDFGFVETITAKNYRFALGHHAIAMFNNGLHDKLQGSVLSRGQFEDLQNGRPLRNVVVVAAGQPVKKDVSLLKYDPALFIAVPKYSNDQAVALASQRVETDVANKVVNWFNLDKSGDEYRMRWKKRAEMFHRAFANEMILVAKDIATTEQVREAADLPPGVLSLMAHKLSITEAQYFISRFLEFDRYFEGVTTNPALTFWVQQVIEDEIQIEHLRDLQRLYGDKIDPTIEAALDKTMKRHSYLISGNMGKTDSDGKNGESKNQTGKVPLNQPVKSEGAFPELG